MIPSCVLLGGHGGGGRERWLASYLEQILTRDAVDISGRDPLMHTGPSAFSLTDRIAAVPIASLWSQN